MNMKKLFSLALLVSALVVAPSFAMENAAAENAAPDANAQAQAAPDANAQQQQQQDAPKGSWCPFAKLKDTPIFSEVYGLRHPVDAAWNYVDFVKGLAWNAPVKTFITLLLAKNIYDNVDNIKSALGLAEEELEADVNQVFADAKCGCTEAAVEEEDEVVEVCELEKRDAKKANA